MHSAVVLLVKANDENEAKQKSEEFLDRYGEGVVWDWYEFGGRWSDLLEENRPVVRLDQCFVTVKKWSEDNVEEKVLREQLAEEKNRRSQGYLHLKLGKLLCEEFSFDSVVYNVEDWNFSVPEKELDQWFAVVVDMHN